MIIGCTHMQPNGVSKPMHSYGDPTTLIDPQSLLTPEAIEAGAEMMRLRQEYSVQGFSIGGGEAEWFVRTIAGPTVAGPFSRSVEAEQAIDRMIARAVIAAAIASAQKGRE